MLWHLVALWRKSCGQKSRAHKDGWKAPRKLVKPVCSLRGGCQVFDFIEPSERREWLQAEISIINLNDLNKAMDNYIFVCMLLRARTNPLKMPFQVLGDNNNNWTEPWLQNRTMNYKDYAGFLKGQYVKFGLIMFFYVGKSSTYCP